MAESERSRLDRRLGGPDPRTRREIAQTMGRIADKLLHGPTVRVKELAGSPGADSYETALRVLARHPSAAWVGLDASGPMLEIVNDRTAPVSFRISIFPDTSFPPKVVKSE